MKSAQFTGSSHVKGLVKKLQSETTGSENTAVTTVTVHRAGEWYKKSVFRDTITNSKDYHSEMGNVGVGVGV